ncbi:hypothetical protein ACFV19_15045 [Streptomyces griseoluteus]|uniref:hypothetical protein n=1 Tax=Streptomyces griseoluteus TaxID=29306 RepID=UPI00367F429A
MVGEPAKGMTLDLYEVRDDAQVHDLGVMYRNYQLEELERTGQAGLGLPVATWLATAWIRYGDERAGFVSLDVRRWALELVYIEPAFRGRGLALLAVADIARSRPGRLAAKTPLSPSGEALANRFGLVLAEHTPQEAARAAGQMRELHEAIRNNCRHGKKRSGDPRKVCQRCYRAWIEENTPQVVFHHAQEMHARP